MVHFVDVHIMLCFLDVSCWWRPVKDVSEVLFPASVCLCSSLFYLCLSLTGASVGLRYLPQTILVNLYTRPCSPLLAASSSWLVRSSISARLSALATSLSASLYCCLCLSFSFSDLASVNYFFKPLLNNESLKFTSPHNQETWSRIRHWTVKELMKAGTSQKGDNKEI